MLSLEVRKIDMEGKQRLQLEDFDGDGEDPR